MLTDQYRTLLLTFRTIKFDRPKFTENGVCVCTCACEHVLLALLLSLITYCCNKMLINLIVIVLAMHARVYSAVRSLLNITTTSVTHGCEDWIPRSPTPLDKAPSTRRRRRKTRYRRLTGWLASNSSVGHHQFTGCCLKDGAL